MGEARVPNNAFVFCRYTVSANLVERATGSALFPFSFTDREGHATYAEAQSRAFLAIEKTIGENTQTRSGDTLRLCCHREWVGKYEETKCTTNSYADEIEQIRFIETIRGFLFAESP
jgi:hypothetical protein